MQSFAEMKNLIFLSRILLIIPFLVISPSSRGQQISEKDFQRDVLDEHNKYRSTHNADQLTLDDKLSKNATMTAQEAARNDNFDNISPGESVFVSCATFKRDVSGKEVTDAWYGEVCDPEFDFNNPDNEKSRGFTQLVWKDTRRIGVGRATGTNNNNEICTYIVGVYRPPGNLIGFFQENVEEGSFNKDEFCGDDDDDNGDSSESDDSDDNDATASEENFKVIQNKKPSTKKELKHLSQKKKHFSNAKKHKNPFK